MQMAKCIEPETLISYLQGMQDPESSFAIESHLLECTKCEGRLSDLEKTPINERLINLSSFGGVISSLDSSDYLNIQNVIDNASRVTPNLSLQDRELGNYRLLHPVGQGGMAVVYKAENKKLQKPVAVKILKAGFHGPPMQRIEREIKAHGKLNHPAIVSAIDAGEAGTVQYLVTEYVDGLDLGKIVKSYGRLPIADACEIIRQSALGIESAHRIGIIHRDIKPSNIMIDVDGQVKVLDFGLVHFQDWSDTKLELTSVGQLLGTLDYMAPEQAENPTKVDSKCDIYSLAATLFCLLTGRAPFAGSEYQSPVEKLRLICSQPPPVVKTIRKEISKDLSDLIDRSLSNSPSGRSENAKDFANSLDPFCHGHQLDQLISDARKKSSSETVSISKASLLDHTPVSSSWEISKPPVNRPTGRIRSRWKNFILGLAIFAALSFSIVFLIQTNRGQIVVEVPDENVPIEVVSSGKVHQNLILKPGTNSIHLFAGKYEIRIKEKPDLYKIDGDVITLGRGKTVLAKITRKTNPPSGGQIKEEESKLKIEDSSISAQESSRSDQNQQPAFKNTVEGKNIQHWLSVMLHEQNVELVNKAIDAIKDLSEPETDHLVREAITKTLVQAKPKLKPMKTDELRIHKPFETQQIERIDKAIAEVEPDLAMIIFEIKVKMIADQLRDEFDDARYSEFHFRTIEQIRFFLDRSITDPSDLTSRSGYDIQLQIVIQHMMKPLLNHRKWEKNDRLLRRLIQPSFQHLRIADLFFRAIDGHPEKYFVLQGNYDEYQPETQTPIVVQNIDLFLTTGITATCREESKKEKILKPFLTSLIRDSLVKPRIVSKGDLAEIRQIFESHLSAKLEQVESDGSVESGNAFLKSIEASGGFRILRKEDTAPVPKHNQKITVDSSDNVSLVHRMFGAKKDQDFFQNQNPDKEIIGGRQQEIFQEITSFKNQDITTIGNQWFFKLPQWNDEPLDRIFPSGLRLSRTYGLLFDIKKTDDLPRKIKKLIIADFVAMDGIKDSRPKTANKEPLTMKIIRSVNGEDRFQLFDRNQNKVGNSFKSSNPGKSTNLCNELGVLFFYSANEKLKPLPKLR